MNYLYDVGIVVTVLLCAAGPIVVWAGTRYHRTGLPVEGVAVPVQHGAYRRSVALSFRGGTLPWIVYAGLLSSAMGAAFVIAGVGYELWTVGSIGTTLPTWWVDAAGVIGATIARLALFDASIAALRRRPSAGRRAWIAAAIALVSVVLYGHWAFFDRIWLDWSPQARHIDLVDGALYTGGLLLTMLLVLGAQHEMAKVAPAVPKPAGSASS